MQSCLALRFLVTLRASLHEMFAFLSNIRPRLACMRMSRKTDFRSSKNNFCGHDISQGLDREPPSLSRHFLLLRINVKDGMLIFFSVVSLLQRKPSWLCWIVLYLLVGHTYHAYHLTLSHACHGNSFRTHPLTSTWHMTSWRVTSMADSRMMLNMNIRPNLVTTIWQSIVIRR